MFSAEEELLRTQAKFTANKRQPAIHYITLRYLLSIMPHNVLVTGAAGYM